MTFSAPDAIILPARIASFELTRLIGRGAIGTVYEASDANTGTPVALKLLHTHLAQDPLFRSRLEQAAELASRLTSPYTARLFDYGEAEGHYYLAGQLVRGQTVRELLSAGRVSLSRSLDIARQVALALEEAESKGLVHGDVRPGNVYLTQDGRVRVLDFGLTRRLQEGILTVAQDFGGTQRYAAPETFVTAVTHQSDIYSLGAVLFHLLTGRPPFEGRTLSELIRQHERAAVPAELLAGYPDAVGEMVMGCLEKDPARRYQSASELVVALERAGRSAALESERRGSVTVVERLAGGGVSKDTVTIQRIGPEGGPPLEQTVHIFGTFRLGSAADNDLTLSDDRTVSGHHALFRREGDGYLIEDVGSRNGTFIERGGQILRVTAPTRLEPGDTVRLGTTRLVFRPAATQALPAAPAPRPSQATVIARPLAPPEAPAPPESPPAAATAPPAGGSEPLVAVLVVLLLLLAIGAATAVAAWLLFV